MEPSRRRLRFKGASAACLIVLAIADFGAARAQGQPEYAQVKPLLRTGESVVGERISYPTAGAAVVQSLIVTLQPGERTGRHRHGVPTYAYILAGQVTVDYDGGHKRTYREGEAFMEAMERIHDGVNDGAMPCRILVVFIGSEGTRNVEPAR